MRLTYAFQAWWGFTSSEDKARLQSLVNKAIRWQTDGQCGLPVLNVVCAVADNKLFQNVLKNSEHVLYQLLPPVKLDQYGDRTIVVPHFTQI